MIRATFAFLLAGLMAGPVLAQGAGGGPAGKPTIAQQLRTQTQAGPGYAQGVFVEDLKTEFVKTFGERKGGKMLTNLKNSAEAGKVDEKDMVDLMNGEMTKSKAKDVFGMSSAEHKKFEGCLDGAVDKKNRNIFHGVLIVILVKDFEVDPKSDFAEQVAAGRDEMSEEEFLKLLKGAFSKNNIKDAYGFSNKDDLGLMQDALNKCKGDMAFSHPMAKSLGMGKDMKFDADSFPDFSKGMAGFGAGAGGMPGGGMPGGGMPGGGMPGGGMGGFGMGGGLPFDSEMPPIPFMGPNLGDTFPNCKPGGEDGGDSGGEGGDAGGESDG